MIRQLQQLWAYILHGGCRLSSVSRVQHSVPAKITLSPAATRCLRAERFRDQIQSMTDSS